MHWRPATYWKPGTEVTVDADINSIPAGNGIYGQRAGTSTFHVGDAVISKVDVATHQMKVFINGKLPRTIPITAGKPGFTTRCGIKVIIEKFRHKRMDAATVGINRDNPEYYDITTSSTPCASPTPASSSTPPRGRSGSQGSANVSHGCVGMSTANAAWLFDISKRGDVVESPAPTAR